MILIAKKTTHYGSSKFANEGDIFKAEIIEKDEIHIITPGLKEFVSGEREIVKEFFRIFSE